MKPTKTAADYAAIAVAPLLIFLMISSLANFLTLVLYHGAFPGRIAWVLMMYTLGAVGIARVAIEQDRAYSMGYAGILGLVTFVAMIAFVDSPLFVLIILGVIAYLADIIVRDCTLIDESVDASGQGLVDSGRLFVSKQLQKEHDALRGSQAEPDEKHRVAKKPQQPGRTVMYLALAALPLFGLGQLFLRHDAATWERAQRLLAFYLFASLSLLVTTSFLGLRRYLRQRRVDMPVDVSIAWMLGGLAMIATVLLIAYMAPLPGRALANLELPFQLDSPGNTRASRFGWGQEAADQSTPDASRITEPGPTDDTSQQTFQEGAPQGNVGQGNRDSGSPGSQPGGTSGASSSSQSSSSQSSSSQPSSSQSSGNSSQSSAPQQRSGAAGSASQGQTPSEQSSASRSSQDTSSPNASPQSQSSGSSRAENRSSTTSDSGDNRSPRQGDLGEPSSQTSSQNQRASTERSSSSANQGSSQGQDRSSATQSSDSQDGRSASQDGRSNQSRGSQSESAEQEVANPQTQQQEQEQQPTDSTRPSPESSAADASAAKPDSAAEASRQTQRTGTADSKASQAPPSSRLPTIPSVGSMITGLLKLVIVFALVLVVLAFLWANRDWILQWWESLVGGKAKGADDSMEDLLEQTIEAPPRAFASFRNPIGQESDVRRIVIITFQAFEAWAREHGASRSKDETPMEFVRRAANLAPQASAPATQIVDAYNRVVYGRGKPTENDLRAAAKVWSVMQGS